jgi:hypothetical protein
VEKVEELEVYDGGGPSKSTVGLSKGGVDTLEPRSATLRCDAGEKWSATNIPTKMRRPNAITIESLFSRVIISS